MRSLVSYLWARQFFLDSGVSAAGGKVFTSKRCVACHGGGSNGAPVLPASGKTFDGPTMVSVLWGHGPEMMQLMDSKNISWPRFQAADMSNLIAFLNSKH
jgi:mono/diheme cytochrome c family protein